MRVKDQPWFVSDTTPQDITWTLNQLSRGEENTEPLAVLAKRWKSYIQSGVWVFQEDSFWTFPHPFNMMADTDPVLYKELGEADLIIFKGDLNYRKLVGDLNWETSTSLKTALQVQIHKPYVILKTC